MTSVLADTIPGIRVVKAFAQERREVERFARADAHVVRPNDRVNTVWSFFGPLLALLTQGGLIVVWAVGAWMVFYRGFQVGVLTMFLAYLGRFYAGLESDEPDGPGHPAGGRQRPADFRDPRPLLERARADSTRSIPGGSAGPSRSARSTSATAHARSSTTSPCRSSPAR